VWAALALLGVYLATASPSAQRGVFDALGASASRILDGDWFRCATALLLHASPMHLAGNMAGLAVFGSAVCGIVGAGVGTMMVALTGILGNLLNAVVYQSDHVSVGASTAVFGAVGILTAHQIRHRMRLRDGPRWKVWLPLGAGIALLGFLSGGPRVDIMAHLFGMVVGGGIGAVYGLWRFRPAAVTVQVLALAITLSVFAAAWFVAPVG
jgi:rhomboid protease GluP